MDKKEMNRQINKLYRQLGKEVYSHFSVSTKLEINNEPIKKIIKKLDKAIKKIEEKSKEETRDIEKIILKPEKNENGISLYYFCKECNVGNNPKSTHCISCGKSLS